MEYEDRRSPTPVSPHPDACVTGVGDLLSSYMSFLGSDSWQFVFCCRFCDVCGTACGYHNEIQEAVPGVIGNHSKLCLEESKIIKNMSSRRFGGCLGSTRFHERREASAHKDETMEPFRRHLVAFVCYFGAHWISKGQSALYFLRFSAQSQKQFLNRIFSNNFKAAIGQCKQ